MLPFLRRRQRRKLLAQPFPAEWLEYLGRNVPLYERLPELEQRRLRDRARVLMAEKRWEGCGGQELRDEIRLTIAAQASLVALGFPRFDFDALHSILVYPGGYLARGELQKPQLRYGEVHDGGAMVVSWWEAGDAPDWRERILKVVVHEVAHLLDLLDGDVDGAPPLEGAEQRKRWKEVLRREYDRHVAAWEDGEPTLLSGYGTENEGEFFAVASEGFFLKPVELRAERPELYTLLQGGYRQDPAAHFTAEEAVRKKASPRVELDDEAYEEAEIERLGRTIREHPDLADAYFERGTIHAGRDEHEKAIADFTAAIRLLPDDAEAYHERGVTRALAGDDDGAIEDLSQAIQLCPDVADGYLYRGEIHARRGLSDDALRDFDRAVELDPGFCDAFSARGLERLERGELAQAIADLTRAIELEPGFADDFLLRGQAHLEKGDLDTALADCDEAVRLDPEVADAYRIRAEIRRALGDGEAARRDVARADELER